MPKSAPDPENDVDFVLKHRITGAAFLLFFGALFVPWLLGPPSVAVKKDAEGSMQANAESSSSIIEDDLLEMLQNQQETGTEMETETETELEQDEEPVYISKITPLNVSPVQGADESSTPGQDRPAATDQKSEAAGQSADPVSTPRQPQVASQAEATTAGSDPEPAVVNQTTDVDVGWAVQVGIYTNPVGVSKVLADLRAKGFKPATTVVDTNQGKGTGTRVWLGPFAQRVDAAKAKALLTEKTGESGFIRIYP